MGKDCLAAPFMYEPYGLGRRYLLPGHITAGPVPQVSVTETILDLLFDLGSVSELLQSEILKQKNPEILKQWVKYAARAYRSACGRK